MIRRRRERRRLAEYQARRAQIEAVRLAKQREHAALTALRKEYR